MKLNKEALKNRSAFEEKGIILPRFDPDIVFENTEKAPTWIHFGAGNIFRGFIARVAQVLLNEGLSTTGVIAADTFDYEIINKIYKPHDNLTLMADLKSTGDVSYDLHFYFTAACKFHDHGEGIFLKEHGRQTPSCRNQRCREWSFLP